MGQFVCRLYTEVQTAVKKVEVQKEIATEAKREVGLALSRYFAVTTPVDDNQNGPCNQSDTWE
jgi:hypothetical protein